jgi:prepilin-type N-terminal cleavage/methylation domain-containing protein
MSTLKRFQAQARARRQGKPAFTLLELIVVLLVLGILAAIAVPTFNRVKENSVARVAQTTLEAIDRNGEAIAISDRDMSDEQVAAAAVAEMDPKPGMTIMRDGAEITVQNESGSILASGTVTFSGGVGTIVPATVGGSGGSSGSSSTTSTTVAPTTTTTVAPASLPSSFTTMSSAPSGGGVSVSSDGRIHMAINDGGTAWSSDGGTTFNIVTSPSGSPTGGAVRWVHAEGSTVYAAMSSSGRGPGGLLVSSDGGVTWSAPITSSSGMISSSLRRVWVSGGTIYVATQQGMSKSTNGGASWTNYTTANGLAANDVYDVWASGSTIYVATWGGLSVSTDGGASWTTKTAADGLGSAISTSVHVSGSTVVVGNWCYAVSVSTDGGASFTSRTSANSGLGNDCVNDVWVSNGLVYSANSNGGGVSVSSNNGASWSNYDLGGANTAYGLWVGSGSTVYVADHGGLAISNP